MKMWALLKNWYPLIASGIQSNFKQLHIASSFNIHSNPQAENKGKDLIHYNTKQTDIACTSEVQFGSSRKKIGLFILQGHENLMFLLHLSGNELNNITSYENVIFQF
jgi:hypothetical protein